MKAKAVEYEGINFRSKLEARNYIFMKEKLGWNIIYEPEIEGLTNWIPDFLIIGKDRKTLVDVKPIDTVKDWEKHPDRIRIEESGIKDLPDYELLILGTNLQLDGKSQMGILYIRDRFWNNSTSLQDYTMSEPVFSNGGNRGQIGFMDHLGGWHCRITGAGGKTYLFRGHDYNEDSSHYKFIDKSWNEAWSKLQWKGKEI